MAGARTPCVPNVIPAVSAVAALATAVRSGGSRGRCRPFSSLPRCHAPRCGCPRGPPGDRVAAGTPPFRVSCVFACCVAPPCLPSPASGAVAPAWEALPRWVLYAAPSCLFSAGGPGGARLGVSSVAVRAGAPPPGTAALVTKWLPPLWVAVRRLLVRLFPQCPSLLGGFAPQGGAARLPPFASGWSPFASIWPPPLPSSS